MKHFYRLKNIVLKECNFGLESLKKYGFKRLHKKYSEGNCVWVNKELEIVVKVPYICAHNTRMKGRIPTLSFQTDLMYPGSMCFIQPLAERHNLGEAERQIKRMNPECVDYGTEDISRRNCGWYKGKPVIFDW